MRILVGMSHPKHVYMFKNFIEEMERKGHKIKILAIEKDLTEYLLKRFNLPYTLIGKNPPSIYRKILSVPKWEYLTFKIAKEFRPDIYVGQALPHFAHVSAILKKPYIIFEDTESATVVQKVCFPFASAIITPSCYKGKIGKKHVCFEGYYELAYLHPNYFKPNPAVLSYLGLDKGDKYIIMRFISWDAIHDIGQRGFDLEMITKSIKELEEYAKVFITSENPLPKKFEKYKIIAPPEIIHDLLYYAEIFVGESGTMATEAGVLGSPAVRYSAFTESNELGNFVELENKYGLVYSCRSPNQAIEKTLELLNHKYLKKEWNNKKNTLLLDKIDVTKFMVNFIENYPKSFSNNIQELKG